MINTIERERVHCQETKVVCYLSVKETATKLTGVHVFSTLKHATDNMHVITLELEHGYE